MIVVKDIFNKNTLNIFTDASTMEYNNKVSTCSGMISVVGDKIVNKSTQIWLNKSSNYGECYAILLGIEEAIYNKSKFRRINLFSDSKISVFAIRDWIFNWIMKSRNGYLYNSKGKKVVNQEIILNIVNAIITNNLSIYLFHINGHIDYNDIRKLNEARASFTRNNNVKSAPDLKTMKKIAYYNNTIDIFTRNILHTYIETTPYAYNAINYVYKPFDINRYKTLIHK